MKTAWFCCFLGKSSEACDWLLNWWELNGGGLLTLHEKSGEQVFGSYRPGGEKRGNEGHGVDAQSQYRETERKW